MFVCVIRGRILPARFALVTIAIATAATTTTAVTTTTAAAAATSTTITATAAATAAAISSRLGFIHGQITAAEVFAVKCLDSCCCLFRGCHFHKSEAA